MPAIHSMTAYGSTKRSTEHFDISFEFKSVNSRYLDLRFNLPRAFLFSEPCLRRCLSSNLFRGKVEALLTYHKKERPDARLRVDLDLAKAYQLQLETLANNLNLKKNKITLMDIASYPQVISNANNATEEDQQWIEDECTEAFLTELAMEALANFQEMRAFEGERLVQQIKTLLNEILSILERVEAVAATQPERFEARLRVRLEKLLEDSSYQLDEHRLLTELAILADRHDISEECTRLRSHIDAFHETFGANAPHGKRLDFIIQEMNREINTMGSKVSDYDLTSDVIEMKTALEKIREQVQNIE